MAILQRVALYPQQRFDVPDARMLEGGSQNDWRYFIKGILSDQSMIMSGFEIANYANIFDVVGVRLQLNNVVLIHPEATTQAAGFYVAAGTESDYQLTLNPNTNFVEAELITSTGTPDVRAFWDPAANSGDGGEYTATVDTVINLELQVQVNVSGFTPGRIPLYKFNVDPSTGLVTSLQDCRESFWRLASGGSTPNPDRTVLVTDQSNIASGQIEAPTTSIKASPFAPYIGGDHTIKTMKEWADIIMSSLKLTKASSYWYQEGFSIPEAYQNSSLSILIGGVWKHEGFTAKITAISGTQLTVPAGTYFPPSASTAKIGSTSYLYTAYNQSTGVMSGLNPAPSSGLVGETIQVPATPIAPGKLSLQLGSTVYRFGKTHNCSLSPFTALDLSTKPILYVMLPKDNAITFGMGQDAATPIFPQQVLGTSGAITPTTLKVNQGGNYLTAGGYLLIRNVKFSYDGYDASTGVFSGISPDPTGLVKATDYVYQENDGASGYYHYGTSAQVPNLKAGVSQGAERTLWLAFFDGTDIHTPTTDLSAGEAVQVGNNTSQAILTFIGSTGESDSTPIYDVNSIPNGTSLREAIKEAFIIIETPIYDEIVPDSSGTGWANGDVVTLPPNTKVTGSPAGAYTIGTDELTVYDNGVLMRKGFDYDELSANAIQLLRDVYAGSYIRFRIATIGGSGAGAGSGSAGQTLQGVYANGAAITITPGNPVTVDGPTGEKLMWIKGDMRVDGVLDPTGVELTPVAANPLASGKVGLWVDDTSSALQFTRPNGTVLPVGEILESQGGNAQNFSRSMTNLTGATIPSGSAVYISAAGKISLTDPAGNDSFRFFGITAESIAHTSTGEVLYFGVVPGIFTGQSLPSGQYVWLSDTPGALSLSPASGATSAQVIVGLIDGDDLILQPHVQGDLG